MIATKHTLIKNATTRKNKRCVKQLLREYKKQTKKHHVERDTNTQYKGDYYLTLKNADDHHNHIHLITKNFYTNNNKTKRKNNKTKRNKNTNKTTNSTSKIGFVLKKRGNTHSIAEEIDVNKTPKKIVSKMVRKYNIFLSK